MSAEQRGLGARARVLLVAFLFTLLGLAIVGLLIGKPHLPLRPLYVQGQFFIERCFRSAVFVGGHNTFVCRTDSWITEAEFDCDDDGFAEVRAWDHDAITFRRCEQWRDGWQEISIAECSCTCARTGFALNVVDGGCM